ncbi:hypothetical protein [Mesorhizobium sp. M2C.T.Ca.TU.002.02.1.1]|uniref:hypothetical protein n=1 Tax=Mesorhizobium sp. M2C.T.Ca.TU.002.02.1.1 TaxID=2496788 RepID=UPI000FCC8B9D|nr:hypothetical protein [Mesorhizobium sp. M2C.T.Ca.TU.002.02.1.1]RUU59447.1 hypothetical protein EOD07_07075 [Mesorhizobium sp. M2C.T.Ca.TU.002.02.1.1]RUU71593.1 hypothetical protein EOD04_02210 [Mesorhizobium sp. M2C.T.Ca.TU.009.01.2.1]
MAANRRAGEGVRPTEVLDTDDKPNKARTQATHVGGKNKKLGLMTLWDLADKTRAATEAYEWYNAMVAEIGGDANVSLAVKTLLERAAFCRALAAHMEYIQLNPDTEHGIHLGGYANLVGLLHAMLRSVGLQKKVLDLTPDLSKYIAQRSMDLDGEVETDRGGEESGTYHPPEQHDPVSTINRPTELLPENNPFATMPLTEIVTPPPVPDQPWEIARREQAKNPRGSRKPKP